MVYPKNLNKGDKVAIISPATAVKPEYIDGACQWLRAQGLEPVVAPHALGPKSGTYAASEASRVDDWLAALSDPEIKAILCSRGGYGCVHLADKTPLEMVRANPKWLIGYSDVSALHALFHRAGIASMHGPMAKHLTLEAPEHYATVAELKLLTQGLPVRYEADAFDGNHHGKAKGMLLGGNMQVLSQLAGTDLDLLAKPLHQDVILFLEDINEPIYAVQRMLMRLWMSGILMAAKGLIFGRFTVYQPDANYPDMNAMLVDFFRQHEVGAKPIAFNFPVGHVADNVPLVEGAEGELEVGQFNTILSLSCK